MTRQHDHLPVPPSPPRTPHHRYVVKSVETVGYGWYRVRMRYATNVDVIPQKYPDEMFVDMPECVIESCMIKRVLGLEIAAEEVLRPGGMNLMAFIETNTAARSWGAILRKLEKMGYAK